jgi:hypothetical protein
MVRDRLRKTQWCVEGRAPSRRGLGWACLIALALARSAGEVADAGTGTAAAQLAKDPPAPTSAAPARTPDVVAAERRWTTRLVEYKGKLTEEAGAYYLEVSVPVAPGVTDIVQVVVGEQRLVRGNVARVTPSSEADGGQRMAIRLAETTALAPGMDARWQVTQRDRKVVALPPAAIRRAGDDATVTIVDPSGATETRAVKTGETAIGGWIEIRSGIAAGDRVLVP